MTLKGNYMLDRDCWLLKNKIPHWWPWRTISHCSAFSLPQLSFLFQYFLLDADLGCC